MESVKEIVLITGSSGRIGAALIERLAENYELIGLDQPGPPHSSAPARCLPVDIESDESVEQALALVRQNYGNRIASVIHLAAYYSFAVAAGARMSGWLSNLSCFGRASTFPGVARGHTWNR